MRGIDSRVAPHVGAWIETTLGMWGTLCTHVAPRAGAWIETHKSRGQGSGAGRQLKNRFH